MSMPPTAIRRGAQLERGARSRPRLRVARLCGCIARLVRGAAEREEDVARGTGFTIAVLAPGLGRSELPLARCVDQPAARLAQLHRT